MKNKFKNYLAKGFLPYLGWNEDHYNEDGSPIPTFPKLSDYFPTAEERAAREAKIKQEIELAFRILKKPGK